MRLIMDARVKPAHDAAFVARTFAHSDSNFQTARAALLANAPPPLLLWSARGSPSSLLGPPFEGSGAPKDARGLRGPSERLAKPPGTLARRAPSALRSAEGRLSALHLRRFLPAPGRALPADRSNANGPPSASSWQAPVVAAGRSPGAARVRGYEPRPRAPRRPYAPGITRNEAPEVGWRISATASFPLLHRANVSRRRPSTSKANVVWQPIAAEL